MVHTGYAAVNRRDEAGGREDRQAVPAAGEWEGISIGDAVTWYALLVVGLTLIASCMVGPW